MASDRVTRIIGAMRRKTNALCPVAQKPAEAKSPIAPENRAKVIAITRAQYEPITLPDEPRRFRKKRPRRGEQKARYKQPRRGCCRPVIKG